MADDFRTQYNEFLNALANELDVPPSKYQQAVQCYAAVGIWLEGGKYERCADKPHVYPQGSFRYGTVVRPLKDDKESDYDIDLVCQLQTKKDATTPDIVKYMVGNRLKENTNYGKMLDDEGRRCWTLNYAEEDGIGFHLDILPSTPEDEGKIRILTGTGVSPELASQAIAITEKDKTGAYHWSSSNPNGYTKWFDERKKPAFDMLAAGEKKRLLEGNRNLFAKIDDVPDQLVKTPLQKAIQILKRHRDMRFIGHKWEEDKPISMVITTLAALAYEKETNVYSTLINIINRIDDYAHTNLIQKRYSGWYLPNPVDPAENFADRWNEPGSKRAEAFFLWISWVKEDVASALEQRSLTDIERVLMPRFGKRVVQEAFNRFGKVRQPSSVARSITLATAALPSRFAVPHRKRPLWPVHRTYQVSIAGRYGYNGERHWFESDSSPLSKGCDLLFVADTAAPTPFDVYWQVVNTGEEAQRKKDLRGQIFSSKTAGRGGLSQKERTAYKGMHWIECFIVKNEVCVARSGEFVVNIQ